MKHTNVLTTQNVTIRYELAATRDRIIALVIDWLVLSVSILIIISVSSTFLSGESIGYLSFFLSLLFLSYHLFSEMLFEGQSLGKRALGIKVIRINGQVPSWNDYFLRWAFRLVDITLSFGTVAFMSASSSESGQRLGDLFAGTTVVRLRSSYRVKLEDLSRARQQEHYEPSYPEVVTLSDEDMLTIKAVLNRRNQYKRETYIQLLHETADQVAKKLHLQEIEGPKTAFLKELLEDYIILTR